MLKYHYESKMLLKGVWSPTERKHTLSITPALHASEIDTTEIAKHIVEAVKSIGKTRVPAELR